MKRTEEPKPVEPKSPFHDSYEIHPAFGVVGISNVHSSSGQVMFGSDFRHRSTIRLRIFRAQRARSLSHDWIHPTGGRPLIEIEMTESQWAAVISNPNRGEGLPCTIQDFNGVDVPGIADPPNRDEQFSAEMAKHSDAIVRRLDELVASISDESGIKMTQTARKRILDELRMVKQDVEKNIPFVVKSASEQVEANKEHALADIHAHLNRARAAVDAALTLEAGREARAAADHQAAGFIDVGDTAGEVRTS